MTVSGIPGIGVLGVWGVGVSKIPHYLNTSRQHQLPKFEWIMRKVVGYHIGCVRFAHRRLALRWAYGTTERKSYPTDLTESQWELLFPLLKSRNLVDDQEPQTFGKSLMEFSTF